MYSLNKMRDEIYNLDLEITTRFKNGSITTFEKISLEIQLNHLKLEYNGKVTTK